MARKNKKNRVDIVYSTSDDFEYDYEGNEEVETLEPSAQELRVRMERRGGKPTTVVLAFEGSEDDMKALGKLLKSKCGVGGSTKDGEILVQGDHVKKVVEILKKEGYSRTK